MTKKDRSDKDIRKAMKEMAEAGQAMALALGGATPYCTDFSFGEFAGESEREIIEGVTGLDYDDLTTEQIDALCDAFLDGNDGTDGADQIK